MELVIPYYNLVINTNTYTRRISTDIACPINFPDCPCVDDYCPKYKVPFIETDLFQFYVSNKPESAVAIDLSTNTVITPTPLIIQGTKITVDFSLLPPEVCSFYIRYTHKGNEFCFEFSFVRVYLKPTECLTAEDYDCGKDTLLLKSNFTGRDCAGNRYTNGYTNEIRIFGLTYRVGTTLNEEKTERQVIIRRLIQEKHKLKTYGLPDNSWLLKHIIDSVLTGEDLSINSNIYLLDGDIDKTKEDLDKWFLDINLKTKPCEVNYSCQ